MCVLCMDINYALNIFGNLLLFKRHLHKCIHAVTPNKIANFILRNQNKKTVQEKFYDSVKDTTLTKSTIRLGSKTDLSPRRVKGNYSPFIP